MSNFYEALDPWERKVVRIFESCEQTTVGTTLPYRLENDRNLLKSTVAHLGPKIAAALREAASNGFAMGFGISGEGYNGEYPFGDKRIDPETDEDWTKSRDRWLSGDCP